MDRKLTLVFAARDASGAALGKLTGSLDKLGKGAKGVGSSFAGMGGKVASAGKLAGLAAVGGIAALIGGLGTAIKAAVEESVGIDRLSTALKNNVPGWKGNTDAIEKNISAKGKLGFADDQLRDSLATLLVKTKDVGEAQRLQNIALDLARAKNIDVATATAAVAKASAGQLGALKKLNIMLEPVTAAQDKLKASTEKATEEQIAAAKASDEQATSAAALAAIQNMSAGAADKYGKSQKGAWDAFQIGLGNIVEDIGAVALPILTGLMAVLTGTLLPAIQDAVAGFADWAAANQPLIEGIGTLVGGALTTLVDIVVAKIIPGIGAVIGAVSDWIKANEPLITQVRDVLNVALQALGDGVKWAFDNMQIVVPFIAGPLIAAFVAWAVSAGAAAVATALALAPLLLVGAAIGVLAVAWSENWGGIRDTVSNIINDVLIPLFDNVLRPAIGFIGDAIQALSDLAVPIFNDFIVPAVQGMIDIVRALAAVIVPIVRDVVVPAIQTLWDMVSKVIDLFSNLFDDVIQPAVNTLLPIFKGIIDGLAGAVQTLFKWVGDILQPIRDLLGIIGQVVDGLRSIIQLAADAIGAVGGMRAQTGADPIGDALFGQRAHGGVALRNRPYLVGERGPELITPGVSSRVMPAAQTRDALAGASIQVQLNVYGNPDPEQWSQHAVQALTRRLRRERVLLASG